MEKLIRRINELSALARERELTVEERSERELLRKKYISSFRQNLADQLDNIYYVETDGATHKLRKKTDK